MCIVAAVAATMESAVTAIAIATRKTDVKESLLFFLSIRHVQCSQAKALGCLCKYSG